MKISFFEIKDWEKAELKNKFKKHSLLFFDEIVNNKNTSNAKDSEIISVFIYSKMDKKTLDQFPKLKLIVTRSTGFNHIDLQECKKRNITVCNVPTYGENTVAEHAFALILALSRNVHKAYVKIGKNDFNIEGLKGFDLRSKVLGVIGTGHIGQHVIRIARGFEMSVIAYDAFPKKDLEGMLGFTYAPLDKVLKSADILTLHIPLIKETHHLINKKALAKMKPSAFIINTSRGEIIDTPSLLAALDAKRIAGAGLDVIEGEELIKEEHQLVEKSDLKSIKKILQSHLLLNNERVVFTPHIAFYSQEALKRILDTSISNIESFISNNATNVVKNV